MFLKSKYERKITFYSLFFPFKEKVKGRMGRTSEKRERRREEETRGEERKRGDSYHKINPLYTCRYGVCGFEAVM